MAEEGKERQAEELRSETEGPTTLAAKPVQVLGTTFLLDRRYEIVEPVGSGAYGVVVAATDTTTGKPVAIKKIEKGLDHPILSKRTLRELKILRLIQHENVIRIITIQLPANNRDFDGIYVVSELMETDLTSIIKSKQALSDQHCQFFLYQILRGLKFLHGSGVLHRDLKPRNLLVNSNCDLKICDFGLARVNLPGSKVGAGMMTDYVATRWYRPPELLLLYKKYTKAMDMWSVGCILGELLLRKPIMPGKDPENQLEMIFNLIGTPEEEDIQAIPNSRSKRMVDRLAKKAPRNFTEFFHGANPLALDLLAKLLHFNPAKRLTVEEALNHPYLSTYHFEPDESCGAPISAYDFLFENEILTVGDIKALIFDEVLLYHFPQKKTEYERRKTAFETQRIKEESETEESEAS